MHVLLNDDSDVRVAQHAGRITTKILDPVDQLLLILPERAKTHVWHSLPQGAKLRAAARKSPAASVPAVTSRLSNKRQTLVVGGQLSANSTAFEQLTFARKLVAAATVEKPGCLGICVHGFSADDEANIVKNVLAASLAAAHRMPAFKQKSKPAPIRNIRLLGLSSKLDVNRVIAEARGNNLARWLTSLPPNKLDAFKYADLIKDLARQNGWQYKRYGTKELEKLNAGAFLAVAQGNENDSASIVRLRYRPGKKAAPADISLVGKGIIFDTGGTNLKPFQSMLEMHGDMQGSAVALGTLVAISDMQLPHATDCWLAITENRTGPNAYKSQDVVTAANGKTIQTIHTDAEGRMALADTLVLASRDNPGLIIDYATLTGSCINAITERYSGIFTNRPEWHPRLKRTGHECGERVWPFPIGGEFLEHLKSPVADLRQCTVKGYGDHIFAGSFLGEFVENNTPWIHIDLSASDHENGLAHIPTKVTGFGVRYTMSLVLDENILESAG
ncbi:MAG: leucyl aminopeptidase family protein [Woeseiaceae bacterium]|nr:leucyl aminopeptidase family protein [Woeseiaceae bacterium]